MFEKLKDSNIQSQSSILRVRMKLKQNNLVVNGKVVKKYAYIRTITINSKKKLCTYYLSLCMSNKMLQLV